MKYLIMEDFASQPVPILFPDRITHADMREQIPYSKVLSAGYTSLVDGKFVCEGGDADVGSSAGADDASIITFFFASPDKTGKRHG